MMISGKIGFGHDNSISSALIGNAEDPSNFDVKEASLLLGIFQLVLLILFYACSGPDRFSTTSIDGYYLFSGVEIMMFIGFGYLMTFMKWHGVTAVGFTLLITAMGLQWGIFTEAFFYGWYHHEWHVITLSIYSMLDSLFAISAVLISFGAIIGKVTPIQLVTMVILELIFYAINDQVLMFGWLKLIDLGGTYVDHMFGAYFGLSVAFVLGAPTINPEIGSVSDLFSLIGTVFLWVYWPSFVGGVAPVASSQQGMAFVNTILSLSSSSIFAFVCSGLLTKHHKFRPVDIQNATLAGGVAIGCVADLTLSPGDAILIGCFAGLVSSVGYQFIQPYLENKIGLHDTCGIHNLHGMPSLVGAISSVLLAASKNYNHRNHDSVVYGNNGSNQWWHQLIAIGVCVSFAVISGTATGLTLKAIGKRRSSSIQPSKPTTFFNDAISWEVAPDFNGPIFSDSGRGPYSPAQIA